MRSRGSCDGSAHRLTAANPNSAITEIFLANLASPCPAFLAGWRFSNFPHTANPAPSASANPTTRYVTYRCVYTDANRLRMNAIAGTPIPHNSARIYAERGLAEHEMFNGAPLRRNARLPASSVSAYSPGCPFVTTFTNSTMAANVVGSVVFAIPMLPVASICWSVCICLMKIGSQGSHSASINTPAPTLCRIVLAVGRCTIQK